MQVILIFTSAVAFIFYGSLCLLTGHMKAEFNRYRLAKFRPLTGALELSGGLGLLVGHYNYAPLLYLSASGLSLLMLLGVIVRIRSKDPLLEILPAFFLMLVNLKIIF